METLTADVLQPMLNDDVEQPSSGPTVSQTLSINVGGHLHKVTLSTLAKFPTTLLGGIACAILDHDESAASDEYFFDRSNVLFDHILQFYRTGSLHVPDGICPRAFVDELSFWRISSHEVAKCCIEKIPPEMLKSCTMARSDGFTTFHSDEKRITVDQYKGQRCPHTRSALWAFLEDPTSSYFATAFMVFSILVVLLTISVLVAGSMPEFQYIDETRANGTVTRVDRALDIIDSVCVGWFTFEYAARLWAAPNTLQYMRSTFAIIDLAAIVPFYFELIAEAITQSTSDLGQLTRTFILFRILRLLRILRVLRVFKIARYSTGLKSMAATFKASRQELGILCLFALIITTVFSTIAYFIESDEAGTQFVSIPAAAWWAVITITTVGYGDMTPTSVAGKIFASLCSVFGIIFLALPIAIIIDSFTRNYNKLRKKEQLKRMKRKLLRKSKNGGVLSIGGGTSIGDVSSMDDDSAADDG